MIFRTIANIWRNRQDRLNSLIVASDLQAARAIDPHSLVFPACDGTPDVSVIIPTYGQVSVTLQCLQSILASGTSSRYEVIVAEDSSDNPEIAKLREVSGITLIENPENLGFLRSCNAASTKARGRYLYFLHNDTRLLPGAIDELVKLADAHPDAGLVGSKLIYPDLRLQEAGGIIWQDGSGWNYGRLDRADLAQYNYVREVDCISGASILIPCPVWDKLGGFDEEFAPAYYEDTDFVFRVREAGMKVLYQPRSVVVHYEGISHGRDLKSGVKAWQEVNRTKFLARWGKTLQIEHFANASHVLRARDRAKNRRVLLVIDHYVPEPDRDAGSNSMMSILQAALDLGWDVKFWPHDLNYDDHYSRRLEAMGIEIVIPCWPEVLAVDDIPYIRFLRYWKRKIVFWNWVRTHGHEIDYALISRPYVADQLMQTVRRGSKARIAYYGHDLHFARLGMEATKNSDRALLKAARALEKIERKTWKRADVVLYPSQEEAYMVKSLEPTADVRMLLPYRFDDFTIRKAQPATMTLLFVAGFGHPPNVDAALWLVQDILPLLKAVYPEIKLVLAGSNPQKSLQDLASSNVLVTGFLADAEFTRHYEQARVVAVPLRVGAGVKLKVVEAMQFGVPLVTTTVGAQGLPALDAIVPVHDDARGFADAVLALLKDDDRALRQSMSQTAYVKSRFSTMAMQKAVESIFEPNPIV